MKMSIGKRIKDARESRGMTLEELSVYAGVTRQTLSRYETGIINNIPSDKIELIADALRTTPGQLMGWDGTQDIFSIPGILPLPRTVKKPRLGSIACGEPILCVQNYDGEDNVPEDIHCDFTLVCHGDSMTGARIMDGDIVYIRQQDDVENREIAAVLIDEERVTLKRVRKNEQGRIVMLTAENPAYDPIDLRDVQSVRILGKAVGFTSVIH